MSAVLWTDANRIYVQADYDVDFESWIKRAIPASKRSFDSSRKIWAVSRIYELRVDDGVRRHFQRVKVAGTQNLGGTAAAISRRSRLEPDLRLITASSRRWSGQIVLSRNTGATCATCSWRRWYVWDGQRWDDAGQARVQERAKATVRQQTSRLDLVDRKVVTLARRAESERGLAAMLKLAASDPVVDIDHQAFDADPYALNTPTGIVDLRTGALHQHRRDALNTKLTGVPFATGARCPTWDRFVAEVLPDDEVRTFVQRYLGYALTGDVGAQAMVFFHGGGANGKSTLLGAVAKVLGDYGCTAPPDLLLKRRHQAHPTELTVLHGRRLAVCSEIEDGQHFAEVQLKQLTGGDVITARRMREDFWEFSPTHKLIVAANHKPRVRGTDEAIWRRLFLVPFDVHFPPAKRDADLPHKLADEGPGILSWLVRGCLDWQKRGLDAPGAVRAATAEYRESEDLVGRFLRDVCLVNAGESESKVIFEEHQRWSHAVGERPLTKRGLGGELKRRGFDSKRVGRRNIATWLGLSVANGHHK